LPLVDTNVLLDIVTDDPVWADRSIHQLDAASLTGDLIINNVVYSELSVRFARIEELDGVLDDAGVTLAPRKSFSNFGRPAEPGTASCRISSSERMPQFRASLF
jgi:hypothetical protein